MNHPRLIAVALAAALAIPLAAAAQTAPAPAAPAAGAPVAGHHHHGSRYMRALRTVALTPDQKAQIKGFVQTMRTSNQNADPATRKANRQQLQSQIDGILTPAQRAQVQASLASQAPMTPGSAPAK